MKILYVAEVGGGNMSSRVSESLLPHLMEEWKNLKALEDKTVEVEAFGIGYRGDPVKLPYKLYPGSLNERSGLAEFPRVLKHLKPDLIIFQLPPSKAIGFITRDIAERSVIFTGDVAPWNFTAIDVAASVREVCFYSNMAAEAFKRSVDAFVKEFGEAIPEEMKAKLTRWLEGQKIIGLGVDTSKFYPLTQEERYGIRNSLGVPKSGFAIGTVSLNKPDSRLEILFKAFSQFDSEALLLCHAPVDGAVDLPALSMDLGIADRVIFTHQSSGRLSDKDLASLYNVLDVYVDTTSVSDFPMAALEAGACGIPLVLADTDLNNWVFTDRAMFASTSPLVTSQTYKNAWENIVDTNCLVELLQKTKEYSVREYFAEQAYFTAQSPVFDWRGVARRLLNSIA